jgi:Uma2 family endonuclease
MVMMAQRPSKPADFLLQDFLTLDTPEGYRAELIDGEIVVTQPPDGTHESIIGLIVKQVFAKSSVDMHYAGFKGIEIPSGQRVIPDATFAPAQLRLFFGAPSWMNPEGIALVTEVTSSRPEIDREKKRRGYAVAGIPLYLLVDRQWSRVTLFSEPSGDDYARTLAAPLGAGLELPKPFAFTLETSEFVG